LLAGLLPPLKRPLYVGGPQDLVLLYVVCEGERIWSRQPKPFPGCEEGQNNGQAGEEIGCYCDASASVGSEDTVHSPAADAGQDKEPKEDVDLAERKCKYTASKMLGSCGGYPWEPYPVSTASLISIT